MKRSSIGTRAHALIVAAGAQGIAGAEICSRLVCTVGTMRQAMQRLRPAGLAYWVVFRTVKAGSLYFAQEDWRDAAAVVWAEQVRQARIASGKIVAPEDRKRPPRENLSHLTADEKRLRWNKMAREREAAARLAKGHGKPGRPPKPKEPKLHALGAHIKAKAADGRIVTKHQSTFDRPRLQVLAAPATVDYSRAKETICPAPTHDRRYQVAPGETVYGAGFAAVGIGRDVTTGRGWGA